MNWLELLSFFLTLAVLVYLFIGDNPLFRLVSYLFVGVSAGYVFILVLFQVLEPRLAVLLQSGSLTAFALGLVPFVLGLLLFFKLSPRLARLGNASMAILVGIGAAVAIGGAVFGTLFSQVGGTIVQFPSLGQLFGDFTNQVFSLAEGMYVLIGAVLTLIYFQFSTRPKSTTEVPEAEGATARRATSLEVLAVMGQVFIGITLGAMFAGVYSAAIAALVERINFVISVFF